MTLRLLEVNGGPSLEFVVVVVGFPTNRAHIRIELER